MAEPHAFSINAHSSGLNGEPADGQSADRLNINGERVHLAPTIEELYERAQIGINNALGRVFWRGDIRIDPPTTDSSFSVYVGPMQSITTRADTGVAAVQNRITVASETLTIADVQGAPSALTSSSTYYIYARDTGVEITHQISTTQPVGVNGGLYLFKSGDTRWVMLGSFVTDSSGAPVPCRARNGRVTIRKGSLAAMQCATDANSTSNGTVALAGLIPPHVRRVTIFAAVHNTTPAAGHVVIADGGDDATVDGVVLRTPDGSAIYTTLEVSLDDSQNFVYSVNNTNTKFNAFVAGWED